MKDLRRQVLDIAEKALKAGWRVSYTGGGHLRMAPADKRFPVVHSASTPSDPRGVLNLRARLRRYGLEV